ncbi:MAG: hypothetical protein WC455_12770 [Dehalococcoidia bacterium]|jgi:hypothetical protein
MPIVRLQIDVNDKQDVNDHFGKLNEEQLDGLKAIIAEYHGKIRRGEI